MGWTAVFLAVDIVLEVTTGYSITGAFSSHVIKPLTGYDPVQMAEDFLDPYVSPFLEGAGEWIGQNLIDPALGVLPPGKAYFDEMFGGIYAWMDDMTEWANSMSLWASSVSQYLFALLVLAVFIVVLLMGLYRSNRKIHRRLSK